jgi:SNF2 family DNA or RNA helicase
MPHWQQEFAKWAPNVNVRLFHGDSKADRRQQLQRVAKRGGVLITTYNMVTNNTEELSAVSWDYVVADEGHKLKNHNIKAAQALRQLPVKHRLLLTGTPIQNNLVELWALFDFVQPGLLGDVREFNREFSNVIEQRNAKDASESDRLLGLQRAEELQELVQPHFLRRDKMSVFGMGSTTGSSGSAEGAAAEAADCAAMATKAPAHALQLTAIKREWTVWVKMSDVQQQLYSTILCKQLQFDDIAHGNLLAALSILVRLCNHPRLLLPTAATIKKQQQQRKLRTPSKTPSITCEVPFENSDDEALEETFGYAQLVAQLPLSLQQQLEQQPTAQYIALHGAKVALCPRASPLSLHLHSRCGTGSCAAQPAHPTARRGPPHTHLLPVTRHARPYSGDCQCSACCSPLRA